MKVALMALGPLVTFLAAVWMDFRRPPAIEVSPLTEVQIFERSPIIALGTINSVTDTNEESLFRVGQNDLVARRVVVKFEVEEVFRGRLKPTQPSSFLAWQAMRPGTGGSFPQWSPGYRGVFFLQTVGDAIEPQLQIFSSSWNVQTRRPIGQDYNDQWEQRLADLLLDPGDEKSTFPSSVSLIIRRAEILIGRGGATLDAQRLAREQPNEVGVQACRALILELDGPRRCVSDLRNTGKLTPALQNDLHRLDDTLRVLRGPVH